MNFRGKTFERVDAAVIKWMAKHGLFLLRISIGVIFLWFGALKYFEGMSPAEDTADGAGGGPPGRARRGLALRGTAPAGGTRRLVAGAPVAVAGGFSISRA